MAEINPAKSNQAFDHRATVKIDRPAASEIGSYSSEKKPGSGKFILVAAGLIVLALVFFLN
jgi:hypothetical protein